MMPAMYPYTYVYIYIYMYTYDYVCIYIYICIYVRICIWLYQKGKNHLDRRVTMRQIAHISTRLLWKYSCCMRMWNCCILRRPAGLPDANVKCHILRRPARGDRCPLRPSTRRLFLRRVLGDRVVRKTWVLYIYIYIYIERERDINIII